MHHRDRRRSLTKVLNNRSETPSGWQVTSAKSAQNAYAHATPTRGVYDLLHAAVLKTSGDVTSYALVASLTTGFRTRPGVK